MRDFTLNIYKTLLKKLISSSFNFVRFDEWAESTAQGKERKVLSEGKISLSDRNDKRLEAPLMGGQDANTLSAMDLPLCILRHDVDRLPGNSRATAKIEAALGIKSTYYFRIVPESFDEGIIKEIAEMGHEIGYHYEEVDTAYRQVKSQKSKVKSQNSSTIKQNNNETIIDLAYDLFKDNLEKIRQIAPVTTICMHGSPLSPYDNKIIWQKYSYKDLGIIGEPYLDIDWTEFGYLTDTGRRWDGDSVSVRDKVRKSGNEQLTMKNVQCKTTLDVINAIEGNKLREKLMITIHPQRWSDNYLDRGKELVLQNLKNLVKRFVVIKADA